MPGGIIGTQMHLEMGDSRDHSEMTEKKCVNLGIPQTICSFKRKKVEAGVLCCLFV